MITGQQSPKNSYGYFKEIDVFVLCKDQFVFDPLFAFLEFCHENEGVFVTNISVIVVLTVLFRWQTNSTIVAIYKLDKKRQLKIIRAMFLNCTYSSFMSVSRKCILNMIKR